MQASPGTECSQIGAKKPFYRPTVNRPGYRSIATRSRVVCRICRRGRGILLAVRATPRATSQSLEASHSPKILKLVADKAASRGSHRSSARRTSSLWRAKLPRPVIRQSQGIPRSLAESIRRRPWQSLRLPSHRYPGLSCLSLLQRATGRSLILPRELQVRQCSPPTPSNHLCPKPNRL